MALAFLVHIAVATLTAMAFGLALGRLSMPAAVISLAVGTAAGILVWLRLKDERRLFPDTKFIPALVYGFILFAGLEHFLYLLYYSHHGLRTLHPNNFGDLSLHIQYIRYIAGGAHFWPENPGFAGELLRYPIGIDIYNGLWEILGVPIDSHLFLTGFIMTVAAVSMLHRWMGWWGVGAFFLNGGLANWASLTGGMNDFQNALAWKSFFLSLWITQRGFLFAIPAGVYILRVMTETLLGERTLQREERVVCALLWASLAWFHLHTFFILTLSLGIFMLLYRNWRIMIEVAMPAVAAGLVFVIFSTGGLAKARVLHLQPGWTAGQENLLKFWLINLGPWLIFAGAGLFFVLQKRFGRLRLIAIPACVLFVVFTVVMLAPWDWDNIKVLIWLYLLIAWIAWKTWVTRLPSWAALLIGLVAFFSGAVSVVSSLPGNSSGVELYRAAELWEAKAALSELPGEAVLAVAPEPNHPAMFWGAKVAMGYTGHLWSHGIDSASRESQLERIFRGRENWFAVAKGIGVTHIYWGENERRKYGAPSPSWSGLKNISRTGAIQIYDLSGSSK
ncbi:MAG TPA: hypothetical protein VEI96_06790 [Thermodesulfovibrionales bacterium]|nr:hypothetical protein [Thermodesulfovibrionales bacterium]